MTDTAELVRQLEHVARLERMEKLIIEEIDLGRIAGAGHVRRPARHARAGRPDLRRTGRGGRRGRHDRAEHRPREPGQYLRHRAQKDLEKALSVAGDLAKLLGCPPPTHCAEVAKLSVFGVGMKSHTGVATRMFQSLAAAGINVEMISTSEVRVNVVVDGGQGPKALAALKKEFADSLIECSAERKS